MFGYLKVCIYDPNKTRWPDRSLGLMQYLPDYKLGHNEKKVI